MAAGVLSRRTCIAALGAAAVGCRRTSPKRVAVIPKGVSHSFWISVQNGALEAGKEFHAEILWKGPPNETEVARQIEIIDEMVAAKVDAIAVAATDRKAIVAPVERANAAGIPVTIFDSGVDSESYVTYVATDNVEAGRMAARKIGDVTGGKGRVGLLMNSRGSASTMDREQGFASTLAREYPKVVIVASEYGFADPAKSRAAAEKMLSAHPDLNAIFTSSEPGSVGAAEAVEARGLAGKIFLLTFDASQPVVQYLRHGVINATIVQDPLRMGYEAVKTLVTKLDGRNPPKRLDLNALLIQAKDLNEPNVRRLLEF